MKNISTKIVKKDWFLSVLSIVIILNMIDSSCVVATDEPPAFFLKIAKTIPRIGRSKSNEDYFNTNRNKINDDLWYKDADNPINKIFKRAYGFSPDDTKTWQHFPLAIEGPPDLWRTLAGYSNDPLYNSPNDFNNGLWSRDK